MGTRTAERKSVGDLDRPQRLSRPRQKLDYIERTDGGFRRAVDLAPLANPG